MIHLLWPTARPEKFVETHAHWVEMADSPDLIMTLVAVDTELERDKLSDCNTIVLGKERPGVARASYALSSAVNGEQGDVIILASDDFYAPLHWDSWIIKQVSEFNGCLVVRDGCQDGRTSKRGRCVTIPIMTYDCLLKLNRIIYHPSYFHYYSDVELWYNLHEMQLLKNLRRARYPLFEHRHWVTGKRPRDEVDNELSKPRKRDKRNFFARRQLSLSERLVVSDA